MMIQSKENFLLVLLIGILLSGVFLRFYELTTPYSEYDDIGVVSLHKSLSSDERKVALYQGNILDININVKAKGIKENLLDSYWYPIYMGYAWTYPVGQYLFYPFFIEENDSYLQKLKISRSFSAIFSSMSLFLLFYLLYVLNNHKLNYNMLLPLSLLACSFNSVLYAHHASPYSLTVTILLLSLLCFVFYHKKKLTITLFFVIHAVLALFNYLVLILLPIYILIIFLNLKSNNFVYVFKYLIRGIVAFGLIFLPVFILFFKPSAGLHGVTPPDSLLAMLIYYPKQFVIAISSSVQGLFVNEIITIVVVSVIFIGSIVVYVKYYFRNNNLQAFVLLFIFVLTVEWWVLHAMGKLIMDQTRHLLMWAPLISILGFLVAQYIKINRVFLALVTVILMIYGVYANVQLINSKKSNLDLDLLRQSKIDTVFAYSFTMAPLLSLSDKNVYNIDVNSFNKKVFGEVYPLEILLVSQTEPINEFLKRKDLNPYAKRLLEVYSVEIIKEIDSKTYFSYNNYPVSSNKNGFYLYKLRLKE